MIFRDEFLRMELTYRIQKHFAWILSMFPLSRGLGHGLKTLFRVN